MVPDPWNWKFALQGELGMGLRMRPFFRREGVWLALTALLEVLFIFLSYLLQATNAEKLVIAVLILISVFIIRHFWTSGLETQQAEYLYTINEALARAQVMQQDADLRIDAVWALAPYDDRLKSYFAITLETAKQKNIVTRRVIDISRNQINDVIDHMKQYWSYLGGSYQIYINRDINIEMMIVDNNEVALFLFSRPGGQCLWERHTQRRHVLETQIAFDSLIGKRFPVEEFGGTFEVPSMKPKSSNGYRTNRRENDMPQTGSHSLYRFIKCTTCGGDLLIKPAVETRYPIQEGALHCSRCSEKFSINGYVPDIMPHKLAKFLKEFDARRTKSEERTAERSEALRWLERVLELPVYTLPGSIRPLAHDLAVAYQVRDKLELDDADFREVVGILASHLMAPDYKRHVADQLYASLEAVGYEKYEDIILRHIMNACLSKSQEVVLIELGSGVGRVVHQYASCMSDDPNAASPYRRGGPSLYQPDSLRQRDRLRLVVGLDFERTMIRRANQWLRADRLFDLVANSGRILQLRGTVRQTRLSFRDIPYENATKVVCILFQTLGNQLGCDLQRDMLLKALEMALPRGVILVSVFNAAAFSDQARPYYSSIRESVGAPLYCEKSVFLSARGVYSRWLGVDELRQLFIEAGMPHASVLDSKALKLFPEFAGYLPLNSQEFYKRRALIGVAGIGVDLKEVLEQVGGQL